MSIFRSAWTRVVAIGLLLALAGTLSLWNRAAADDGALNLQQATATPSGQLVLPTATATLAGGASVPGRTPTAPVVSVEAVGEANLRSGPGLDFDVVGTIQAGDPVRVVGRSPNFPWYVVEWPEGPNGVAWVFEELVVVHGDITTQPLYPDPAAPTVDPTQAAIQATATVLLQTPGAAETATATALFEPTGIFTSTPGGELTPGAEGDQAPSQFTAQAPAGANEARPLRNPTTTGAAIPPAMVIITLGGLGVLALVVSVLRRQ